MPAPYPQEFREDVVRVARSREDGVTLAQIAKDFGVHEMTLHKWIRQADIDDGNRPGRSREESTELREARKRGPLRTLDSLQLRLHAQPLTIVPEQMTIWGHAWLQFGDTNVRCVVQVKRCLLYTSDAADDLLTV